MKIATDLYLGASCILEGIIFFWQRKKLWKYAVFPLLLTVGFYGLILWGLIVSVGWFSLKIAELCSSLPSWLNFLSFFSSFLIYIAVGAIFLLVVHYCAATIFEAAGGPFFDALINTMEEEDPSGTTTSSESVLPFQKVGFFFVLKNTLQVLIYTIFTLFLYIVLSLGGVFVPIVGQIAPVGVISYRLTVSYLAAVSICKGLDFKKLQALAWKNVFLVLGAGLVVSLFFHFLPVCVIFLLPGIVCGNVILFRKLQQRAEEKSFTDRK